MKKKPIVELSEIARSARLWYNQNHAAFATIYDGAVFKNVAIWSDEFKFWLIRTYVLRHEMPPSSEDVRDVIEMANALAFKGQQRMTFTRIGYDNGRAIYLDLGADDWGAIEITTEGWRIVKNEEVPVAFIRNKDMLPLPVPEPGGTLGEFRRLMNIGSDDDFQLAVGWLIYCFYYGGDFPTLVINGEENSAKSSGCKLLRRIIDPVAGDELMSPPQTTRDLISDAYNNFILAFDNISTIPAWLSDDICRLSTGSAIGGRALYKDVASARFAAKRPIILNGIPDVVDRNDLARRIVSITFNKIKEGKQLTRVGFWEKFDAAHPRILYIILDAVSVAMKKFKSVALPKENVGLTDFVMWGTAIESAFGWTPGSFLRAYKLNRQYQTMAILEANTVGTAVLSFMKDKEEWIGTASDLMIALDMHRPMADSTWPKNPKNLGSEVRRIAPALRTRHIEVEFSRNNSRREICIYNELKKGVGLVKDD